jgi:hypothetical protein
MNSWLLRADILEKLSNGSKADALMAYKIAFEMYESATQQFLSRLLTTIPIEEEKKGKVAEELNRSDDKPAEEKKKEEAPCSNSG